MPWFILIPKRDSRTIRRRWHEVRLSELSLDALFNGVSTFVPGTEVERIDFALSSPQSESTGVEEFIQRDETEQFKDLKKDDFKAAIGENKAWGIT